MNFSGGISARDPAVVFLNSHQARSSTPKAEPQMRVLGQQNPRNRAVMFLDPRGSSLLVPYPFYSPARNSLQILGALFTNTGLPEVGILHALSQPGPNSETLNRYPETHRPTEKMAYTLRFPGEKDFHWEESVSRCQWKPWIKDTDFYSSLQGLSLPKMMISELWCFMNLCRTHSPAPESSVIPPWLVLDRTHLLTRMLSPRTFFLMKRNPSSSSTGSWHICQVLSLTEVWHLPAGTQVEENTFAPQPCRSTKAQSPRKSSA